jgi:small-conductance mechanosensitive channel
LKKTVNIAFLAFIFAGSAALALIAFDHAWREQLTAFAWESGSTFHVFLAKTLFQFKPVRVFFVLKSLVFIFFLHLITRIVQRTLNARFESNSRLNVHHKYLLSRGATVAIYAIGLTVGIRVERIDLTTLAIVGGTWSRYRRWLPGADE